MISTKGRTSAGFSRPRLRHLVIAIAAIIQSPPLFAVTKTVTSCGDTVGDNGSLRSQILAAAENDTIDLSTLSCANSVITLEQGVIPIAVGNLTVSGSATKRLAVSGNNLDRVFEAKVAGTFTIDNLTVEKGSFTTPQFSRALVSGGCVYSLNGGVALNNATVTGCSVIDDTQRTTSGQGAQGGAISTPNGNVTMSHSTVSDSFVDSIDANYSTHGGCIATHTLIASYSTISGCIALGGSSANSAGGGAVVDLAIISLSTIYNNAASAGGGLEIEGGASVASAIYESTISGNSGGYGGAIESTNPLTIVSSTIAFNHGFGAAGIYISGGKLTLQSSILANNADSSGKRNDLRLGLNGSLAGADNIITHTTETLPPNTITADPQLAPLAMHGGFTPVHAFNRTSPALDAGANPLELSIDQRGVGFPRTFGSSTDIGAYESQGVHDDEIFYDGLERFTD
ncbi:MAG TPA: choice-of-anchor Q domain-containing protein [Rudaea sp.]|jgi:hypothetical protein|nr:choice-of-anchor Q domain-containing protein [Rudaea sp.]